MARIAYWPNAGCPIDQAAWVVDGFPVLAVAEAVIEGERQKLVG
ncbi:MAG: hypothetical protein ACKO54_13150 [Alphaproteobacteria bacterium]